jgi:hypothetical protein
LQNLLAHGDARLGQVLQSVQNKVALPQLAEGKLANRERVPQNPSSIEQRGERLVVGAQMVDPETRITLAGSRWLGPPPGYCQIGLAAAQTRKPPRAFPLDQCLERLADQSRFLPQADESLSLRQELIIQR